MVGLNGNHGQSVNKGMNRRGREKLHKGWSQHHTIETSTTTTKIKMSTLQALFRRHLHTFFSFLSFFLFGIVGRAVRPSPPFVNILYFALV